MSCGVGCRCGSDPGWLWFWCRLAAPALIGPLAWKPPYAVGTALEKAKRHTHTHTKRSCYRQGPETAKNDCSFHNGQGERRARTTSHLLGMQWVGDRQPEHKDPVRKVGKGRSTACSHGRIRGLLSQKRMIYFVSLFKVQKETFILNGRRNHNILHIFLKLTTEFPL